MYRPDRIGPFPFVTLNSGIREISPALVEAAMAPIKDMAYYLDTLVANVDNKSVTFYFAGLILAAGEGIVVGPHISGSDLKRSGEYIYSYGGAWMGDLPDNDVVVMPVLGRLDDNISLSGLMPEYALLPSQNSSRTAGDHGGITSCNGSVLEGDFKPEGTLLTNDVMAGFGMFNYGASPATIQKILFTISVHRYLEDLDPFDPNR